MTSALFIGRFQPFHNAHLADIKKILKENNEIIIGIGSSNQKNTLENPFSYSERKKMIEAVMKGSRIKKCRIYPIPDLYNDRKWVGYIRKNLPEFDSVYSGNRWTLKCFRKWDSKVKKIKLIRGISSTIVRNKIIKNQEWSSMVPKEIYRYIIKIKGAERIRKIKF